MKEIKLTRGMAALVDDDDFEELSNHKWHCDSHGYATRAINPDGKKQTKLFMHVAIMGSLPGFEIDHVNRDRLDNRRENLRHVTRSQNMQNQMSPRGASIYKGVFWESGRNKWRVRIKLDGKMIHIGYFHVESEAGKAYNEAAARPIKTDAGVHFFLDDYQFDRIWTRPDSYIDLLKSFECVMSPDFSMFTNWPRALQIYNHYRKHWLAAYWQRNSIKVIPTICWSDEDSFNWCFDGEPTQSTIAVSSVGAMRNKKSKEMFIQGYKEMVSRLNPETIFFYGSIPEECEGNIVQIKPFQSKFTKE